MRTRKPDEITLRDVVSLVRRNRFIMIAALVLCTGAAAAYALLVTPIYEATTSIRVQTPQPKLPEVFASRTLMQQDEVLTEMEELRSRTLAEHVADSLGLQLELLEPERSRGIITAISVQPDVEEAEYRLVRDAAGRFRAPDSTGLVHVSADGQVDVPGASFRLTPEAAEADEIVFRVRPREEVVKELRDDVQVMRSSDEINIITLRYRHPDPRIAESALAVWTDRYMRSKQDVQKTEARSLVDFLRRQLDTLTAELTVAENELRDFREREQVVNPNAESLTGVEQQAELRAERNLIDAERRALAGLLRDVEQQARAAQPGEASPWRRLIAFPSLLRTQATSELFRSLAEVEQQEAELLRRRTPADPDVQVLAERRRALEQQLRDIATTYLSGLDQQVAALDATLAESGQRLSRLPAREVEYARLQRAPEVLAEMVSLVQTRLKEAQIAEAVEESGSRIVDAAFVSSEPVRPKPALNLAFGVLIGLVVGLVGAGVREFVDASLHTRDEIEAVTGAPVLGMIPRLQLPGCPLPALAAESYGRLYINVAALRREDVPRTLLVTSPLAGDGKTTTAYNLTESLAEGGYRTLLIDGDLRRGSVHQLIGSTRTPGLTDILEGRADFDTALRTIRINSRELYCIPSGTRSGRAAALLRSRELRALLARVSREFDAVIIDSPPVNLVTDATVLAEVVDGVIVVARAGSTAQEALDFTMRQLRLVDAPVLGTVLNDIDPRRDGAYDEAYRYLGFKEYYHYLESST